MEPDAQYFEPFIKPLLNRPGSTYRHSYLAGYDTFDLYNNYDRVMSDTDLFPVTPLDLDDPRRQKPNPDVLFVGNLARLNQSMPRRLGSLCNLSLMRFASSMVSNELIHRDGLARMLFWVPESDKANLFACNESTKNKLSMAMGVASQMTEVVGVTPLLENLPKFSDFRGPDLSKIENQRVRASMQNLRMNPPREVLANYDNSSGRHTKKRKSGSNKSAMLETAKEVASPANLESSMHSQVPKTQLFKSTSGSKDGLSTDRPASAQADHKVGPTDPKSFASPWDDPLTTKEEFVEYLTEVQSRFAMLRSIHESRKQGAPVRVHEQWQDFEMRKLADDIKFPQCRKLAERSPFNALTPGMQLRAVVRWDSCLRVHKLGMFLQELRDKALVDMEFYDAARRNIVELGLQADILVWKLLGTHFGGSGSRFKNAIDHQISFFSQPPGLLRDRRLYEPLKASELEFWPPSKLMLLDIQPREIDFLVKDLVTPPEQQTIISQLLTQLLHATATPVGKAMDQIAPNMAEDLIPLCPTFSDPRRGGRLDAANMRVGMLTEQMIRELIVAFVEWPFRPPTLMLELATDGSATASGEEGDADTNLDED
nr:hypothetical protein CFP56_69513 [Quercus suber]